MRNKFDEQLEQLNVALITTGALCEDAISTAAKALLDNDMELAKKVKPIELEIDQKEREIENLCMRLLLQQQPVAGDLRQISSALARMAFRSNFSLFSSPSAIFSVALNTSTSLKC